MAPSRDENQDRIRRMETEGVLDPAQAEMLRASLAGPGPGPDGQAARERYAPGRRRWPGWAFSGCPFSVFV